MQKRMIILVASAIFIACMPGQHYAASIGLFNDAECASCNLTIANGGSAQLYLRFTDISGLPSFVTGFSGAEFRVEGLPVGWSAVVTPNPLSNLVIGDPFSGSGVVIGFPAGIQETCIDLFSVVITATTAESDVVLNVQAHNPPTHPQGDDCPSMYPSCDGVCPFTPPLCVGGGQLFINSPTDCNVAVRESTWAEIKELYDE